MQPLIYTFQHISVQYQSSFSFLLHVHLSNSDKREKSKYATYSCIHQQSVKPTGFSIALLFIWFVMSTCCTFYVFFLLLSKKNKKTYIFETEWSGKEFSQSAVPTTHLQYPMRHNRHIQIRIAGNLLKTFEQGEELGINLCDSQSQREPSVISAPSW